jgi:hypothetical protein
LVYVFILCLYCPVFRQRSCDELITRPRSPTVCKMIMKLRNQPYAPKLEQEERKKKDHVRYIYGANLIVYAYVRLAVLT